MSESPSVRRTCPACEARVPGAEQVCAECGADMDAVLFARRYGGRRTASSGAIVSRGLFGVLFALGVGGSWFAMSMGYPPVNTLAIVGLIAIATAAVGAGAWRARR